MMTNRKIKDMFIWNCELIWFKSQNEVEEVLSNLDFETITFKSVWVKYDKDTSNLIIMPKCDLYEEDTDE